MYFEDWFIIAIVLVFVLLFICSMALLCQNSELKEQIISNSDNYIIYKDCTYLDNQYYCNKEN